MNWQDSTFDEGDEFTPRDYKFESSLLDENLPPEVKAQVVEKTLEEAVEHLEFLVQRFGLLGASTLLLSLFGHQKEIVRNYVAEKLSAQVSAAMEEKPPAFNASAFFATQIPHIPELGIPAQGEPVPFKFPADTLLLDTKDGAVILQRDRNPIFITITHEHSNNSQVSKIINMVRQFLATYL